MLTKTIRSLWTDTAPEKILLRAQRFIEKGRPDSAAGVLRDALQAGGEEPSVRMELSRILISMNRAREAGEGLKRFLKAHPKEAHQVQELIAWARSNHHEAGVLNEVLAEHFVGRRELRAAFEALENLDKGSLAAVLEARLANLKRFLDKQPGSVPRSALPLIYLAALTNEALHEDPRAVEIYHRIITAHPSELPVVEERLRGITARHYRSTSLRVALAGIYMAGGDIEKAVAEYESMAEIDPKLAPEAAKGLREILATSESPERILTGLVKVLRAGKDMGALVAAGRDLLRNGGSPESLLEMLEAMVADGKQSPDLLLLLGEAAASTGKISRAVSAFSAAFEESTPEVQSRARAAMEKILETHPGETKVAETLADLAIKEGRHDDAVAYLSGMARDAESAPRAASRLQALLISNPSHEKAQELLETLAPSLDDPHLAVLFLRRRLREGAGAAREALEASEKLMERWPEDPVIRIASVEARAACGDMDGAWSLLEPLLDGTTGPDPTLFHLLVHIGSQAPHLCEVMAERFCTMAPALAGTPEGQFCLGEMQARSGNVEAAMEAFRSAASFSPAAATEALSAARELCGEQPSGRAAAALAELHVDIGDFAGASRLLATVEGLGSDASRVLTKIEKAHRQDTEDGDRRMAFAAALAAAGRTGHARQLIDEGIQRAGAAAPGALHLAAGDAWLRDGNLGEAVRSYSKAMAQDKTLGAEAVGRLERVLALDVGHAGAHLARGRGLLLDGNPREGVNALLTAWSIRPAHGAAIMKDLAYAARAFPLEPSVDFARAQITMGQGDVEAATAALGAALRTSPTMAPEVLARLQAILRSHPSCAPAHLHAARAWRLRERFRESGEEYLAALELDPQLVDHVAAGIAELLKAFPDKPEPHLARARMEEARGNPAMAAEAYESAAHHGAEPEAVLEALRRLVEKEGPHSGRSLLAMARAARLMERPEESAAALVRAVLCAPETMDEVREEGDRLTESFPESPAARLARARILTVALQVDAALPDVEAALDLDPSIWGEAARFAGEIADAGGDAARCALLRARALATGGDLDAAAVHLDAWSGRAEGEGRAKICLLRSRVERRRGDSAAARRWLDEASAAARDRQSFVAALHEESRRAALAASRMTSSAAERWRALGALIDLGDAGAAERLAMEMGLSARMQEGEDAGDRAAAREVLARIACLRGRHGDGARILEGAQPSSLKSHLLRRSGRLIEAAACLEQAAEAAGEPGLPAPGSAVYRSLAAGEFLGEPGCLQAETILDFSTGAAAAAGSDTGDS